MPTEGGGALDIEYPSKSAPGDSKTWHPYLQNKCSKDKGKSQKAAIQFEAESTSHFLQAT